MKKLVEELGYFFHVGDNLTYLTIFSDNTRWSCIWGREYDVSQYE